MNGGIKLDFSFWKWIIATVAMGAMAWGSAQLSISQLKDGQAEAKIARKMLDEQYHDMKVTIAVTEEQYKEIIRRLTKIEDKLENR